MRRLEALDLRAFEKLASFLASRAERLGQVLTGRALLLGTGVMTTSVAAFYSAMSPDVPVQSFVDPSSALAWLGVRSQTVAEQIERLAGGAPEDGGMLAAARARLNKNSASTLKDLARQIGTSPRTLQRRLRDLGTTFQLEARHARLELAKRLLRDTNYSIKWIALECGCASLQHFSAFFREHEGVPPSRWRVGQTMVSRAAAGVIS
jgi:AraC-like DNA-binding protein